MAKVYDNVSWEALRRILLQFGFHENWVQLVMQCDQTVQFAISINGSVTSHFLPKKGIRQGDPISPYLFILLVESLSRKITMEHQWANIKGIRITRHYPPITHSQFADDIVLYGEATYQEIQSFNTILKNYARAIGQKINFQSLK